MQWKCRAVDVIYVLLLITLYAVTRWLVWAIARLGGVE
jgi:hypothetical protein